MMLEIMGAASATYRDVLWWCDTLKRRPPTLHTWFSQKSKCGGEWWESHQKAILVKKKKCVSPASVKKYYNKKKTIITSPGCLIIHEQSIPPPCHLIERYIYTNHMQKERRSPSSEKQKHHMWWNNYITSLTIQSQIVGGGTINQGMREPTQTYLSYFQLLSTTACLHACYSFNFLFKNHSMLV